MTPALALLFVLAQPASDTDVISHGGDADLAHEVAPSDTSPTDSGDATSGETSDVGPTDVELAAEPAPLAAPSTDIKVEVIALRPNGQIAPALAEVRLERRRQTPGSAPSTTQLLVAMTNAEGVATFPPMPPVGMGENDRVIARFDGHEVAAALSAENNGVSQPVRLIVREVSRDLSKLRIDLRVGLTPLDNVLRIEHIIRFDNPTHTVVDTDQKTGLRVPLLLPAPFGEPARGLFPGRPDPNELIQQVQPDLGRLQVESGDLVYRGPIPPDGLTLRIIMAVPYDGESHHNLALSSPVELAGLTFIAQSPPHVALALALDRASRIRTRSAQGGEELTLTVVEPPSPGTAVALTVGNTPDRHGLTRPLAAGLSVIIIGALLIVLAAPRRERSRDPAPHQPS